MRIGDAVGHPESAIAAGEMRRCQMLRINDLLRFIERAVAFDRAKQLALVAVACARPKRSDKQRDAIGAERGGNLGDVRPACFGVGAAIGRCQNSGSK